MFPEIKLLITLRDPRDVVPESNMPAFPWLFENKLSGDDIVAKMKALNIAVGATCPKCELYTQQDMDGAKAAIQGKTEAEALVAYLQDLGTDLN